MKSSSVNQVGDITASPHTLFLRLVGILATLCLIGLGVPARAETTGAVPLARVEPSQMSGDWYIVATIPNFLEHAVIAGHDVFTLQPEGYFREDFYMKRGSFDAKTVHAVTKITIQPNTGNADWRVHIFGLISLPFQVFYVDPDYKFALFGEQNRKWGWIYSRTQTISDTDYDALLQHFKELGYDTSKFRKFVQLPEQIGQPGYWNDGIQPTTTSSLGHP